MTVQAWLKHSTLVFAVALAAFDATAQPFPSRAVKIVVPATTGGAIDLIARSLAEKMSGSLGQPVVVENKPGASNNLGTDFVAKSPPDGYTLVIVASSHATNKHMFKTLPYDPVKDFEPVAYTHVVPLLLAVHPSVGAKNVQELVAWINANPDKANYASSGPGSSLHMAAELFMSMSKTKMQHIPYKGSSAAHPDLISGRTAMIFDTVTAIRPHVRSGAVRGLAVTTLTRSSAVPELPTIAETAGFAGYDASTWGGILAPAGTPKDTVAKLNTSINAALKMEDVRTRLTASGIEIQGGTPEQFGAVIRNEVDKWGRIVKEAGIQPE
jgi:tripartite-type tricarboxylate transporter receptor subunit TctC